MSEGSDSRIYDVEEDGSVVPLFGPPPLWLRVIAGIGGVAVWAGVPLAILGAALAVGGALDWAWSWRGVWLAVGGFVAVWAADRAAPLLRRPAR